MPTSKEHLMLPGDLLLFRGKGLFSQLIRIKTWGDVSHSEIYVGNGMTVGSRNGQGVNIYALDEENLRYILRPIGDLDLKAGFAWHATVMGQPYDWLGLGVFLKLGKGNLDKQFCSEHNTRFYRHAGFDPFAERCDADVVAPRTFLVSPKFRWIMAPSPKG